MESKKIIGGILIAVGAIMMLVGSLGLLGGGGKFLGESMGTFGSLVSFILGLNCYVFIYPAATESVLRSMKIIM